MYDIPTSVEVNGQSYPIADKGDYRMVLDCFVALNDDTISEQERLYSALIIFYDSMTDILDLNCFEDIDEAVKQMYIFFNCGNVIDENSAKSYQLIDWKNDSQLICSAINKVSGQEIRAVPYMHWWTFMGYYLAIGNSPLATIVGIRNKLATNQKMEKYERKFMQENPEYFKMDYRSVEDREYDNFIREVWNSGG